MKRGFTLIELLVAIAIISLLMAISMPALYQAREQAKMVVVNGELYGIGIALEAYAMENAFHFLSLSYLNKGLIKLLPLLILAQP